MNLKQDTFDKDPDYGTEVAHEPNTTLYGEFVCSTYKWLPLDTQKEQTKKLEKITSNKNQKNTKRN